MHDFHNAEGTLMRLYRSAVVTHIGPVDTDSGPDHVLTDSHIRALLPGSDCITSLNWCWSPGSRSFLHLLANFGNLQQLELQLDKDGDCLRHLSGLKGLLELHLEIRQPTRSDMSCDDVLGGTKTACCMFLCQLALLAHGVTRHTWLPCV